MLSPIFPANRGKTVWLALLTVYLVWGTTYLATRVVIDSLPPLLMASIRFIVAGALFLIWSLASREGQPRPALAAPGPKDWAATLLTGAAMVLIGNGAVAWAARSLPSGIVALLMASVPFWMTIIDRIAFRRLLDRRVVVGLTVGFAGLLFVMRPIWRGSVDPLALALTLLAAVAWSTGSVYSRQPTLPGRPLLAIAAQMLFGGVLLGLSGAAAGELHGIDISRLSGASVMALAYLVVFGSLVGFFAYLWLLRVVRVSVVSTYAYVNPIVAVLLGWALLGERVTLRTVLGGTAIIIALALIAAARQAPVALATSHAGPRHDRQLGLPRLRSAGRSLPGHSLAWLGPQLLGSALNRAHGWPCSPAR